MPSNVSITDLIEEYSQGPALLESSTIGLTDSQLDALPVAGTWSIRQIVAHTVHMDAIACDRMTRMISENTPLLVNVDENAAIAGGLYEALPLVTMLSLFRLNREIMTHIFKTRPQVDFSRVGVHTHAGLLTVQIVLEKYVKHLKHHVAFIEKKRGMV